MDVVRQILDFNAGREPERLQLKYDKMQADAFVFLRGSCHLFYQQLACKGVFKSAPPVWSCGDLHFENFGSYKGDNRLAYFDMNDFDEAILAPASWDLVRMLTSLQVGAHSLGLRADEVQQLCEGFLQSYASTLSQGKAYWVETQTARGLVGDLLDGLRNRLRPALLDAYAPMAGKKRAFKGAAKRPCPPAGSSGRRLSSRWPPSQRPRPSPVSTRYWTWHAAWPAPAVWGWSVTRCWCRVRARQTATTCWT